MRTFIIKNATYNVIKIFLINLKKKYVDGYSKTKLMMKRQKLCKRYRIQH